MEKFFKTIHSSYPYLTFLVVLFFFFPIGISNASKKSIDLTELTLEQLMEIEITTVSRKPEKLSDVASAVYVITQEEIRRSGVTSIPEALRMVPGMQVAQITSNKWAISARGFNDMLAKFVVVLVDGRNVYSPLFGGANWDEIDSILEDISRIEVIRGPGATMWGANALNGVVNIITKNSKDTQGGLLTFGGGNIEEGFGSVRYGGKVSENAYYRAWVKYFNRDSYADKPGVNASDRWDTARGGFRIDWDKSKNDSLTIQGDFYSGNLRETIPITSYTRPYMDTISDTLDILGGNVLARWNHQFSNNSDMKLQFYYDRIDRDNEWFREVRNTADIDFQHHFRLDTHQDIVWGLRYNFTQDKVHNSSMFVFHPDTRDFNLFSAFIQDEIELIKERLSLILGIKVEDNHYTDFEAQPSGRLLLKAHENHSMWAAISRAIKRPTRGNRDARINAAIFPLGSFLLNLALLPNRHQDSVELVAYEVGYRFHPSSYFFVDIAGFYNDYDDLLDIAVGDPFLERNPRPHLVIPLLQTNDIYGNTYGAEITINWKINDRWKLVAGYTWFEMQLDSHLSSEQSEDYQKNIEGKDPENQFQLRSYFDLPWNMQLDAAVYYVDRLSRWDIPSYVRLDTRLEWRPSKNLHMSIAFQNLLDNHHPEFDTEQGLGSTEVERSFYIKVMWRF
jgi:iron complex outermembrane receptor protein